MIAGNQSGFDSLHSNTSHWSGDEGRPTSAALVHTTDTKVHQCESIATNSLTAQPAENSPAQPEALT